MDNNEQKAIVNNDERKSDDEYKLNKSYKIAKISFLIVILILLSVITVFISKSLQYKTIVNNGTTIIIDLIKNEGMFIKNDKVEYFSLVAQIESPGLLENSLDVLDNAKFSATIYWRRGIVYYGIDVTPYNDKIKKLHNSGRGFVIIYFEDSNSHLIYPLKLAMGEGVIVTNFEGNPTGLSYKGNFKLNPFDFKAINQIDLVYSLPNK